MISGNTAKKIDAQAGEAAVYKDRLTVVKHSAIIHYIGSNPRLVEKLSVHFEQVTENKSLLQVFNRLTEEGSLPVAVLIDMPVSFEEIQGILGNPHNSRPEKLLICCNEAHLRSYQVAQVQSLQVIDDVFDFEGVKMPIQKRIQYLIRTAADRNCNPAPLAEPFQPSLSFVLKRVFDCLIAGILLLVLSPVLALIALAIYLESGGPVIYSQPRVGKGYRVFRFFKFRTMVPDADKQVAALQEKNLYRGNAKGPSFFKIENDPRITPIGRVLRNTSLDELPQLFNVLRGDMSIVGNRPLPLYEAETLTSNECVERFCAPAGITGLWQVTKRGRPEMTVEERVQLDIAYARKVSMMMDFKILAATPKALFQKSNV